MLNWTRRLVAVVAVLSFSCGDNYEGQPDAPPEPACSDGKDNDGDGLFDFPEDPGCADSTSEDEDAPVKPQCSDGRDNDRDGLKDFPNDPGCLNPLVDVEKDDCPNGAFCPQCSNRVDDDGSGANDFPLDPGCESAADNFEYAGSPQACGANLVLKQLPPSGMDTGMVSSMSVSNIATPCGGGGGAPAIGYIMVLSRPTVVVITTLGSSFDTVVDLRKAPCMDSASAIACHDDVSAADSSSKITASLDAGVYYIIVQGQTTSQSGTYVLKVEKFKGEGETCSVESDCGPGLVCRVPVGGTQKICTKPVCSDGLDDDGDGDIDHPNDPGCVTKDDADETDDCPSGPSCPDCADGVDNDGDMTIDFPMDTSCKAAADSSEACTTSESITVITQPTTSGNTTNAVNDHDPTCNSSTGLSKDLLYRLDLPQMQTFSVNVTGFDTVQTLLNSTCNVAAAPCNDFPPLVATNLAAGTYFLSVEGYFTTGQGPFTIAVSGTIALGGSCEGDLVQSGAIACPTGTVCDGTPGARTCRSQCTDAVDNNGDGKIDYPNDPGCLSPNDNSEDTVCPGPMCPQCADGVDNDGDSQIDYPNDTACTAASSGSEACAGESDPIGTITSGTLTDTLVGTTHGHTPTTVSPGCPSSYGVAADKLYAIQLPAMASLRLDTEGSTMSDTVISLMPGTCSEPALACDDDGGTGFLSLLNATNIPAGQYYVAVDAWSSSTTLGQFKLNTSGTIALGGSCEGALAASGAIACPTGAVCDGPPGARTCRTQCSDAVDNNGDGKIDYPNDPGCSSPLDNTETTVCPGTSCPQCADGVDNDGDTFVDYPMDPQCLASGASSESCLTSEPIASIVGTTTTGTTAGQINDYKPACGAVTHTAPDVTYQIDVPQLQSLTFNMSSTHSRAHSLLDASCSATPISCSTASSMTINNVAAGRYFYVVDGFDIGSGAFTVTTSGVIAPTASCESPLFGTVLSCATGTTCQGPVGARRCLAQCSDGVDNNGDGTIDFPNDPSCTGLTDNTETTVCPGTGCPVCSNGADDDSDSLTDFPADFGCRSAAGTSEAFCSVEPNFAGVISQPATNGTLAAPAANNYNQTCQGNTGADVAYALVLPVLVQTLRVDTIGSTIGDTVISVKDAQCGTQLGCDDDGDPAGNLSLLNLVNVQPGSYAIQVDSYNANGANNGPFKLNVRGTVAPGTACTSPLFATGVLVCGSGTSCTAGVCQ